MMTGNQLIAILKEWSEEQPDCCRYNDGEGVFEPGWEVLLGHPPYGSNRSTKSWTTVFDAEGFFQPESWLIICATMHIAKPNCLEQLQEIIENTPDNIFK